MAILVSAHQIKKGFAARPLFESLTFAIESGERVGLIGPNGAGKSTLLRILAGRDSVDSGQVSFQKGVRVGYLEQVPAFADGATVLSTVLEGLGTGGKGKLASAADLDWETHGHALELISRLELDRLPQGAETPIATLSGGWKKRAALARELARKPDLLLLDEPTNHLDVEGILWLEEFLEQSPFATLTITHDRAFLQSIARRILEIDPRNPGGLLSVQGSYADFLETKESVLEAQASREQSLRNTLRRETEWLRRGAKARTTKQQARIQRAEALGDEVGELAYRNRKQSVRLDFEGTEKSPKKLIEAKAISKAYDGKQLFSDLNLRLGPGSRIGLLGPNGCGKSTLIRVLLGQEKPDSGEVFRSDQLQVAYFEQNRESLDPTKTLLKTVCPLGEFVDFRGSRVHVRSYLGRFLFSPGQAEMAVGKLSGGEQSRLLLALLMLKPANLLVLDEPTNDLDVPTLNVLQEVLEDFPGAVLLVTHDRFFLDQVATQILAFDPAAGEVVPFEGLDQWESWHARKAAEARAGGSAKTPKTAPASATESSQTTSSAPAAAPKKKKLGFKEQRELDGMEAAIHHAEAELTRWTEASADPANAARGSKMAEIAAEIAKWQAEVDRLYARWAELSE